MTIFERIRNKANQALQSAGNFIDRDKTMGGVQLAQGGLGNRIKQEVFNPEPIISRLPGIKQINDFSQGVASDFSKNYLYNPETNRVAPASFLYKENALPTPQLTQTPGLSKGESWRQSEYGKKMNEIAMNLGMNIDMVSPRAISGGMVSKLPKRPADTMYTTPEGTTFKVNKQPRTTASLDQILQDADETINPVDKTVIETKQKLISAPKENLRLEPFRGTPEVPKLSESLPQVEIPAQTSPIKLPTSKSKIRKIYEAVTTPSLNVIEKSGPSGKTAATLIRKSDEEGARLAGDWLSGMNKALTKLTDVEKTSLADVIEGKIAPISQAQSNAANTWRYIANSINDMGRKAGLDLGKLPNYFPHFADESLMNPATRDAVRKSMNRSGQRRYGNLEMPRELDVPYKKDPQVLLDYIEDATRRVTDAQNFGPADEILYDLSNKAGFEGGDTGQINSYLDQILGKNQNPVQQSVAKFLTGIQKFKLNPVTAVRNLTQNISTLARTDPEVFTKAVKKIFKDPEKAKEIFIRSGESAMEFEQAIKDIAGAGGKYVKGIGMGVTERANRLVATNVGYEYASKLVGQLKKGSKAAFRELENFGFTPKQIEDGLRESDFITAGRRLSQKTQFSTKAGELPFGWKTPIGQIATQFKPFSYKQTGFLATEIGKRIIKETRSGNIKPLMAAITAYGLTAPIAGELINDIKSVISNKKREDTDSVGERYVSNLLTGVSLGLLDLGPALTGEYGPKGIVSTIGGPTVSTGLDILEAGANIPAAIEGDKYAQRKIARNVTKQIPVVGQAISNTAIPNSYVDNLLGGVNEGLNEPDKEIYRNLQKAGGDQAELFKEGRINERTNEPGFLEKLFKPQTITPPTKDSTPEQIKKFDSDTKAMLEVGGIPDSVTLKQFVTKGKNPNSSSIEERTKVYSSVKTLMDNENYSDEQKTAILEASGIDKDSFEYYNRASKDQDVRLQELLPMFDNMDTPELVQTLMQGRKAIAGKQLISNTMVDYLYENDYISESEKKAIKAIKFDEIKNKFYISKSASGGGSLTYKQALALYKIDFPKFSTLKDTSSLLQSITSQRNTGSDTLISDILKAPKAKRFKFKNKK